MKTIMERVLFFAVAGTTILGPISAQRRPAATSQAEAISEQAGIGAKPGADDEYIPPEVSEDDKKAATVEVRDSYYVERRSYGTKRIDGTKPEYVVRLSETGIGVFKNMDYLVAGLDYRYRHEYRYNDLRRPNATLVTGPAGVQPDVDTPALLRTRLFLKVENIVDPFRFTVEIEDARRYPYWNPAADPGKNPRQPPYAADDRDFNYVEPIQAFGELYFKNLFGYERPLHIRIGRMAFEFLDRRLIALNEWRNTTNTFQGVRTTIGQEKNNWYLELLAVQPLVRYLDRLDQPQGKHWFYGAILSIQEWSHIVTIQPYYLGLQQDGQSPTKESPELLQRDFQYIHTAGIRAYAVLGKSGFDYDVSYTNQWGIDALRANAQERNQNAFYATAELGYTFHHRWKPRLAAFYGYVSGDLDRNDATQNRFNRLFGFARPWSAHDYFQLENLNTPKIVLEFEPFEELKIDTAYAQYWVASPKDRWNNARILLNPTAEGNANTDTKIGDEYNLRIRYPFPHLKVNVGYAYFKPGSYTTKFLRGGDSHFAYLEVSAVLLEKAN
jgi:hypothetical protein